MALLVTRAVTELRVILQAFMLLVAEVGLAEVETQHLCQQDVQVETVGVEAEALPAL